MILLCLPLLALLALVGAQTNETATATVAGTATAASSSIAATSTASAAATPAAATTSATTAPPDVVGTSTNSQPSATMTSVQQTTVQQTNEQPMTTSTTMATTSTPMPSDGSVGAWAAALDAQLRTLRDNVMKVPAIATLFADTEYEIQTLEAEALADELAGRLRAVLDEKEKIVTKLRDQVEALWSAEKNSDETNCGWRNAAQQSDLSLMAGENEDGSIFPVRVGYDSSAVKLAPSVEPDNILKQICFTESLDQLFKSNDPDEVLPWQYFGSHVGYHRQYPQSLRAGEYDPRERPWYTGSSSGPKDVVLVLDTSGSMSQNGRMPLMKEAVEAVLSSLTVQDHVNVVTFSTTARTFDCAGDSLLPADPANIEYLKTEVENLKETGQTNFYAAFDLAFSLLENSKNTGRTSDCRRAILFLTDGEPSNSEDHVALIESRNAELQANIFTYALGSGAKTQDEIACANQGAYTNIEDGGNLRGKMSSYYQLFAIGADRRPFWTAPYYDASGLGMMVTTAAPTFDNDEAYPQLLGVVGHDILLSDFTALVGSFDSGKSYAFLVDGAGNAVMHPRMATNRRADQAPIYQDISVLESMTESTEFLQQVRAPMLTREPGSYTMTVERVQERGDARYEGVRTESLDITYVWREVGPFMFCYAFAAVDVQRLDIAPIDEPVARSYFHKLQLYPEERKRDLNTERFPPRDPKYPNSELTFEASTVYLAPRAFENPSLYINRAIDRDFVLLIDDVLNEDGRTGVAAGLRLGVRDTARQLSALNDLWVGIEETEDALGWLYVGTEQGVHRRYPGGDQKLPGYDPTRRPWYKRALAFPGALVVSTPYVDASGLGLVVTLSHSVVRRQGDAGVGGVVGLDFQYEEFARRINAQSPCKSATATGRRLKCVVFDSSGYVITHPEFDRPGMTDDMRENVFLGDLEPGLAAALAAGGNDALLVEQEYNDFRDEQVCTAFVVNGAKLATTPTLRNRCGSGTATMQPITINGTLTNIFVAQLENWGVGVTCEPPVPGCVPIMPPDVCADEGQSMLARSVPMCPALSLEEDFLQNLREQDPDGGTCGGISGGIAALIAVLSICACGGIIFLIYHFATKGPPGQKS